jgi:hypothetical protein
LVPRNCFLPLLAIFDFDFCKPSPLRGLAYKKAKQSSSKTQREALEGQKAAVLPLALLF